MAEDTPQDIADRQATGPAPPDEAGGAERVEIHHKTHPIHGWREFLKEVGIIVLGVLIALGAEQLVEWSRVQHELKQSREAIRAELSYDAANLKAMLAEEPCVDARLRLVEDWANGRARLDSSKLASMRSRPLLYSLHASAWEATKSGGVAAHVPVPERLAYADTYDQIANEMGHIIDERHAWDLLARYAAKQKLSPAEAIRLKEDINSVRVQSSGRRLNTPFLLDAIARLGIKPGAVPVYRDPRLLCGRPV